jgi:hypothetical protein
MLLNHGQPQPASAVIPPSPTAVNAVRELRRIARQLAGRPRAYHRHKRRVLFRNDLSDVDVDVLILQLGPTRIWDALDRLTQTPLKFAAE